MKISIIFFIIGTIFLIPVLYTLLTLFTDILSFGHINLYDLINFEHIFKDDRDLFFGISLWGVFLWIVSIILALYEHIKEEIKTKKNENKKSNKEKC